MNEDYLDIVARGQEAATDGRLDEACELYQKAASVCPREADVLTAIGAEIIKTKRYGKAHNVLLEAVKVDPECIPANRMLGTLYLFIGKPGLAVGCFKKVVKAKPQDDGAHFLLGRAYYESKEMELALTSFRKAYDLNNRTPACYRMILTILEILNRIDEMEVILKEGLEKFPKDDRMKLLQAKFEARRGSPDKALKPLSTIHIEKHTPEVAAMVLFEKAQALDKLGKEVEAFQTFTSANNFQKKVFQANGYETRKPAALLEQMQMLDLDQLKSVSRKSVSVNSPVFLVGFPRSGTTLLNRVLDAHSEIEVMEERPPLYLVRKGLREKYGSYPECLLSLDQAQIDTARTDYFNLLKSAGKVDAKGVIVDKLPLNIIHVPLIYLLFPDARFIFALRHPCDVCLSCFMQNFSMNDEMAYFLELGETVQFYAAVMSLWQKFCKGLPLQVHTVRYEQLIENFEDVLKKLISFLGLEWQDNILDYRKAPGNEGFLRTPSYAQVIKPIYQDARNRWHRYSEFMTPHFKRLEPYCKSFGYELKM